MNDPGSITQWIQQLRECDPEAAERLWSRYASQVLRLASKRLGRGAPAMMDEEDVTTEVFQAVFDGVVQGRFPQLRNREDLWGLLIRVTERRTIDVRRHEGRLKRGGAGRGHSPPTHLDADRDEPETSPPLSDPRPTPAQLAMLRDECENLMRRLGDPTLWAIAMLRLQGHTVEQIAARLGRPLRTIERKLALIRRTWEQADD